MNDTNEYRMNKLDEYQNMLNKIYYYDSELLDVKFNHMLDEMCLYIQETSNTCWEMKLSGVGRVIYRTEVEDKASDGRPWRDEAYSEYRDVDRKINLWHEHEGQRLVLSEYDDTTLQLYFDFIALRMTVTFKNIELRLCRIQDLDLYKINKNFDDYGNKIKENNNG